MANRLGLRRNFILSQYGILTASSDNTVLGMIRFSSLSLYHTLGTAQPIVSVVNRYKDKSLDGASSTHHPVERALSEGPGFNVSVAIES